MNAFTEERVWARFFDQATWHEAFHSAEADVFEVKKRSVHMVLLT